jgi:hypothetical protein
VEEVVCPERGRQGIGVACTHVAHAIESGETVGFFWGDSDTARPDAWCWECEQALRAVPVGQTTEAWFLSRDYRILCAACWDLAKHRLYESRRR